MKISYKAYQTFIFCLFIISGEIKFLFTYYNSPVDITLLFSILILLDIVFNVMACPADIKFNSEQLFFTIIFCVFYCLFFVSLIYSPSESYGYKKTIFFSLNLLAFTYPIFIRSFDINFFYKLILFLALPATGWFIVVKYLYWSDYRSYIDASFEPLLGSYLGLSMCIAFLMFYLLDQKKLKLLIPLSLILLALGSRGTLIFVIIVVLIFKNKDIRAWLRAPRMSYFITSMDLIVITVMIPLFFIFRNVIFEGFRIGIGRFESLLNFGNDNSTNERVHYFGFAINHIFESLNSILFGYGIGSFGVLFSGQESRDIPHNVFLEAWFELGIVGVTLLALLTLLPLLLNRNSVIKMMSLFFLLDSLKSGGLDEMRFMFGILGALVFIDYELSKNSTKLL